MVLLLTDLFYRGIIVVCRSQKGVIMNGDIQLSEMQTPLSYAWAGHELWLCEARKMSNL